jgi:voltage-gated sodium channel
MAGRKSEEESDFDFGLQSTPSKDMKVARSPTEALFQGMVKQSMRMKRDSTQNLGERKSGAPQLIDQYLMYEHILEEQNTPKVKIVDQMWFRMAVFVATLANVVVLALEADFDCWEGWWDFKCQSRDQVWQLLDMVITVAFLVEICLRLYCVDWTTLSVMVCGFGIHNARYLLPPMADMIIVLLRAADVFILSSMGVTSGLKLISAVRVMHAASIIKSLRLVRFFRELWLIVSGVGETLTSLFYIFMILMTVLWCFAILFTLAVERDGPNGFDYSNAAWSTDDYWGHVSNSCFTLFQICTGDKWASSIVRPLIQQKPLLIFMIIPFLCLTVLGLLNGIVGIVVENVLNSARANDESEGKEKRMVDAKVMESLRTIFVEADTDGSNSLEYEELVAAMQKPHVRRRMQVLELPIKDLDLLFAMLDEERKGSINIDVFFRGCARMRGPAMAADLHQMSIDLDRNISAAESIIQGTEGVNDVLERLINQLDVVEVDVVRADGDNKDPVLMARRERMRKAAMEDKAQEQENARMMYGNDPPSARFARSHGSPGGPTEGGRRGSVGSMLHANLQATAAMFNSGVQQRGRDESKESGAYSYHN